MRTFINHAGRYTRMILFFAAVARSGLGNHAYADDVDIRSRPLFRSLQQTLEDLARVELSIEQAVLLEAPSEKRQPWQRQISTLVGRLRNLDKQVADLLRIAYRTRPSKREKTDWTVAELESLSRNLQAQLARALRNQAILYADGSPDRQYALGLAQQRVASVVNQPISDRSIWSARLEQIRCLLLANRHPETQQLVERWLASPPSIALEIALTCEHIRLLLAMREPDRALKVVESFRNRNDFSVKTTPEFDDAALQAILAARRLALDRTDNSLTRQALTQLEVIRKQHGSYWIKRGELLFGKAIANAGKTDDPLLLDFSASYLFARGEFTRAISTYDRIEKLQAAAGQPKLAFQAAKRSTEIARQHLPPAETQQRLRNVAVTYSKQADVENLHLTAIAIATDQARNASPAERSQRFEEYIRLLDEHLDFWPQAETATRVRKWKESTQSPELVQQRAQLLSQSGDRVKAIALYRQLVANDQANASQQEDYAMLLSTSIDPEELAESLTLWQRLEKQSKPGGTRWWRSRRARIKLLKQLGQEEQAEKLERLTEVLYPNGRNDE